MLVRLYKIINLKLNYFTDCSDYVVFCGVHIFRIIYSFKYDYQSNSFHIFIYNVLYNLEFAVYYTGLN